MTFKPDTNLRKKFDQITILVGGVIFILFIIGSWVPRDCPVVRKILVGCPTALLPVMTDEEREIQRHLNQIIADTAIFTVKAEPDLSRTKLIFYFRADYDNQVAELSINTDQGYQPVATVTHPFFYEEGWQRLISKEDPTLLLLQRENKYGTVAEFMKDLPSIRTEQIAADSAAARILKLSAGKYQDISQLADSKGLEFVISAHNPTIEDSTWREFNQYVDLEGLGLEGRESLDWAISTRKRAGAIPFLLSEVHINYRKGQ